jgi:ABC-type dipeptide/oligopeptide/nickel transport system permease subunit
VARGVRTSLLLGGVVTSTVLVLGVAVGLTAGMVHHWPTNC